MCTNVCKATFYSPGTMKFSPLLVFTQSSNFFSLPQGLVPFLNCVLWTNWWNVHFPGTLKVSTCGSLQNFEQWYVLVKGKCLLIFVSFTKLLNNSFFHSKHVDLNIKKILEIWLNVSKKCYKWLHWLSNNFYSFSGWKLGDCSSPFRYTCGRWILM